MADGDSEYERYLRLPELLALQKPPERRTHPDELLFQSIHQVEELWMKVIAHEIAQATAHLDADSPVEALRALERACRIEGLCEAQLRLFETMTPAAYLAIRAGLGRGSGLDSPGFAAIHQGAERLGAAFGRALERHGADLLAMYRDPGRRPDLFAVAEEMVSFDGQMQRFKREHVLVVKRIIGTGTASLRGNPIEMLERSAQLTYFPMLWAVRERLFMDFRAGPLTA